MTPELSQLRRDVRTLSIGGFWGAIAFLLLAVWLGAKFPDQAALGVALWLLAAAVLIGAILLLVASLRSTGTVERLTNLKGLVALALLVGGALVLLLGAWLFFSKHREALGEAGALCLLGLIGIGVGWALRQGQTAQARQERIMERLVGGRQKFGPIAILIGLACAIVAVWLRFGWKADFPEWGGALALGFIFIGAGIWLFLSSNVNAGSARILVLIVGGLIGLDIAVMTAARAWLWRDEVFFRGISEWRGPEGWRIWLCAYLILLGLALMFGSFYLARTDIRVNPILRRVLYGYNAVFTGLLLLAFLVCLNIVVYAAYPLTFDWSETRGLYTLSQSTQDILERLKKDVTVYSVMSPRTRVYKDLQVLLDNCKGVTGKFQVVPLSPDQNFTEFNRLAKRYPEIMPDAKSGFDDALGRGLLIVYGPEPKKADDKSPPHAFIPARKLFDIKGGGMHKGGGGQTYTFVGEKVLMTELLFLMEGQRKSKIYFLQGDGEINVKESMRPRSQLHLAFDQMGMGTLIDRLKKENYEVQGLSFGPGKDDGAIRYVKASGKDKRIDIPEDADKGIVVIAGASLPIPKETLDALSRYMDRGGRLVVLTDIVTERKSNEMKSTGLEDFLKKYNVDVTNDYVLRFPSRQGDLPEVVYAMTSDKSDTMLARKFTDVFPLWSARVVKPTTQSPTFKAEPLLEVGSIGVRTPVGNILQRKFWAENQLSALYESFNHALELNETGRLDDKLSREPLPVAVTVTETAGRPRLAVFGDAEWATDYFLNNRNLRALLFDGDLSFNLLVSTFDWLAERPGVGARPKDAAFYTMEPKVERARMVLLPLWLMIVVVVSLGMGIWLVRRK